MGYLLELFQTLSCKRTRDGFGGLGPISYQEIQCYEDRTGIRLDPWETSVIDQLDATWLRIWNGRSSRTGNPDQVT